MTSDKMARFRYTRACFCLDIQTGAIILAWIGILCAGFSMVETSIGLAIFEPELEFMIDRLTNESTKNESSNTKMNILDEQWNWNEDFWNDDFRLNQNQAELVKCLIHWAFILEIATSIFNFILNICLLYGLNHEKHIFMVPWMVTNMAGLLVRF